MQNGAGALALRRGRCSQTGRIYLVTTGTVGRAPIFENFWHARCVVRAVHDQATVAVTLAFVVMPDHVHWLFELAGDRPLSQVVGMMKSRAAWLINEARSRGRPVWTRAFHDHAVRREESIAAIARYLVLNPVRAGLVKSWRDYPHWDAVWLDAPP